MNTDIFYGVYHRYGIWDTGIFSTIVNRNEYRIPDDLQFLNEEKKWVVDIGAHIGSFLAATASRGALMYHALEADPDNFSILAKNIEIIARNLQNDEKKLDWEVEWCAVTGNKTETEDTIDLYNPPRLKENTGAFSVFGNSSMKSKKIHIKRLKDILQGKKTGYLKLDCEGSEFPILFHSQGWEERVDAICGEYHLKRNVSENLRVVNKPDYLLSDLVDLFESRGYKVETSVVESNPALGNFFAVKKDLEFSKYFK